MSGLRCDVCGRWMEVVPAARAYGFSWRCPNEGFLWHFDKERAA